MTGPLVLFPLNGSATPTRADLLAAKRSGADEWRAGEVTLKPFMAISDEKYRLYTEVTA